MQQQTRSAATQWRTAAASCKNDDAENKLFFVTPQLLHPARNDHVKYTMGSAAARAVIRCAWPPAGWEDMWCHYCGYPLKLSPLAPFPIPEGYLAERRAYPIGSELTHGPACALADVTMRRGSVRPYQTALIQQLAREMYPDLPPCTPAPCKSFMIRYGGWLSMEEYLADPKFACTIRVAEIAERFVPANVVHELRAAVQQGREGVCVDDLARFMWQVRGLERPPHVPRQPSMPTHPAQPTEFDVRARPCLAEMAATTATTLAAMATDSATTATALSAIATDSATTATALAAIATDTVLPSTTAPAPTASTAAATAATNGGRGSGRTARHSTTRRNRTRQPTRRMRPIPTTSKYRKASQISSDQYSA